MTTFIITSASVFLFVCGLILGREVYVDTGAIRAGEKVDHEKGFKFRAIAIFISSLAIPTLQSDGFINEWGWDTYRTWGLWLTFISFAYWTIFDHAMNIVNEWGFFHMGSTAKTDRFVRMIFGSGPMLLAVKIFLTVTVFFLYKFSWFDHI